MFRLIERIKGMKDIIHLEIGDPDENTHPRIVGACIDSLRKGETHYTPPTGIDDFKTAIQETTLRSRGFKPDKSQILVTAGANIIIYLTIRCLVKEKGLVSYPNPGFPTYSSVCDVMGIKNSPNAELAIVNSPSNPTGWVVDMETLKNMYRKFKYVLSDEIYSRIYYGAKFRSISRIDKCKKKVIILNGFSKAFAMTGWRLGVAIGPSEIIEKMGLLHQTLVSCVPEFVQRAGIEAINIDKEYSENMMKRYRDRRDYMVEALNNIHGILCPVPMGSFYLFPSIRGTGLTSEQFAEKALKHGVALLPGTNFGSNGEGYVRISYATSMENLKEGIKRLESM